MPTSIRCRKAAVRQKTRRVRRSNAPSPNTAPTSVSPSPIPPGPDRARPRSHHRPAARARPAPPQPPPRPPPTAHPLPRPPPPPRSPAAAAARDGAVLRLRAASVRPAVGPPSGAARRERLPKIPPRRLLRRARTLSRDVAGSAAPETREDARAAAAVVLGESPRVCPARTPSRRAPFRRSDSSSWF